ncbi:hypothetical protein QJS66_02275 [Kocuria rhizophila]|nr:hypothetical protein QJS66_02275 [Kocuria rhizophila]
MTRPHNSDRRPKKRWAPKKIARSAARPSAVHPPRRARADGAAMTGTLGHTSPVRRPRPAVLDQPLRHDHDRADGNADRGSLQPP